MARTKEAEIASLAAAVAALQQLDAAALQRRWRALVGGAMPADLGRPLTLRVLAYKLQVQQLGDLDKASVRELTALYNAVRGVADKDKSDPADAYTNSMVAKAGSKPSNPAPGSRSGPMLPRVARPGTLLVREHGGVLQRVMILDEGVTWNGRTYDSLSKVAFAITGTKWNGPRFFGLRDKGEDAAKDRGTVQAGAASDVKKVVIGRRRAAVVGRPASQRASP